MTFVPRFLDDLRCRECAVSISIRQYRRFQLCPACEAAREADRMAATFPQHWTEEQEAA